MRCTWVGCKKEGRNKQKSKDGRVWANLCADHATELETVLGEGNPKGILSMWVKANGGSKKLSRKMTDSLFKKKEKRT